MLGTITSDIRLHAVANDRPRHLLITISYISLLPCHGTARGNGKERERVERNQSGLRLFLRSLCAFFARLRKTNGDGLFTAFHLASSSALPDRSVPCFLRRIALATRFPAALPYLRRLDVFLVGNILSPRHRSPMTCPQRRL